MCIPVTIRDLLDSNDIEDLVINSQDRVYAVELNRLESGIISIITEHKEYIFAFTSPVSSAENQFLRSRLTAKDIFGNDTTFDIIKTN